MLELWNKISVSTKSYVVLVSASLVILVSFAMSWFIMTSMHDSVEKMNKINDKIAFNNSIVTAHLAFVTKIETSILQNEKIVMKKNHTNCKFGKWYYKFIKTDEFQNLPQNVKKAFVNAEKPHTKLHTLALNYVNNYIYKDEGLKQNILERKIDHIKWRDSIRKSIRDKSIATVQIDPRKCKLGKWYYEFIASEEFKKESKNTQKLLMDLGPIHQKLHESAKDLIALQKAGKTRNIRKVFLDTTKKELDTTLSVLDEIIKELNVVDLMNYEYKYEFTSQAPVLFKEIKGALNIYTKYLETEKAKIMKSNQELEDFIYTLITTLTILSFFGFIIGIYINRNISNVVKDSVSGIANKIVMISDDSTSVDNSSKELSELSSTEANNIKKTTAQIQLVIDDILNNFSSLDELEKMANSLNEKVSSGNVLLQNLSESMGGISQSSEEISNIIKTIDEISFQTNLLSLNAAVEAARAGEHGVGFAVVADEVRNLASNSANSSKKIATIIHDSVGKINDTTTATNNIINSFDEILKTIEKTKDMIVHINKLSQGQSQSMGEVTSALNKTEEAILQIDELSHRLATVSEELNVKASDIEGTTRRLMATDS
jgi:hypothetical protein